MPTAGGAESDVAIVNGCRFPKRLHYDVNHHLWYEPLADGLIRVGMTPVATALADHRIYAFTPKRVGRAALFCTGCGTSSFAVSNLRSSR